MKFCENSTFFYIWIFYFRKNKMKVGFGCEKSWEEIRKLWAKIIFLVSYKNSWNSTKTAFFQGANTVKIFSPNPAFTPLFGLCFVHIWFLKKMPSREIFFGKLLWKSHKNQTQKTKFLEENATKIVLFERKKNIF